MVEAIVRGAYGGDGATYSEAAEARIAQYEKDPAIKSLPICMSKTQYSLSDDASKLGAPKGFKVHVKDIYCSAGAGFLVASQSGSDSSRAFKCPPSAAFRSIPGSARIPPSEQS